MTQLYFFRFPVAVKTSFENNSKQLNLLLEEAKNMIQLTEYHDHIVNLQGITYTIDKEENTIRSVGTHNHVHDEQKKSLEFTYYILGERLN